MCRLLGITNFSFRNHKEILNGFIGLAEKGQIPPKNEPGHTDGWGLGFYIDGQAEIFKSGGSLLKEKDVFLSKLKAVNKSDILIAHLRKSSWKGTNSKANSHPFEFKNYVFAHNGTIFDYKKLAGGIPAGFKAHAKSLDSEVFLRYLASSVSLSPESELKTALAVLGKNYKHSSLTCLFSDGIKLFAFREYTRLPGYYTLFKSKLQGADILCSEPVLKKLSWKTISQNKVVAF